MPVHLTHRLNNIRSLRVFLTVYEARSITKAAQLLNLTQPTVSIQLRQLAEVIGMPLYQVVGKQLVFTQAADILATYSYEVFDTLGRLEIDLADLSDLRAGTLKVAIVTSAKYFIPDLLGSFCRMYPRVDVELTVGNREKILQRYQKGLDDIYLFSHLETEMASYAQRFLPNRLFPIAAHTHPLAKEKAVTPEALLSYPLISRELGSGTRYAIDAFFAALGFTYKPKLVIESNEAIKHCVMAEMGIAILSEYALQESPSEDFARLPVDHFPIQTYWHIVRNPFKHQTPLADAFVTHIMSEPPNLTGAESTREQASKRE